MKVKIYESGGHRLIKLTDIRVPLQLATGAYEELNDDKLIDHFNDIYAEFERRELPIPHRIHG